MFSRGYKQVREKISKPNKYLMCCQNCKYFSREKGDTEEVCQNDSVLSYDIVTSENSVYCLKWQPYEYKNQNSLFKKGGAKIVNKKEKSETRKVSRKRDLW